MSKPWSEMTKAERIKVNDCSRERMRRYREEGRYDSEWARYHREARKLLESSDKKMACYSCGTDERPVRAHHIDGDHTNNDIGNLAWCCHSCDTKEAYKRKSAR